MMICHVGPLWGLFGTHGGPKRAHLASNRPKLGEKLLSALEGPDLVPTAADWSDWVGNMVTTHFGLESGLFWVPRDHKRTRFGPKCPFWGSQRSSEGPWGPDLVPTAADWSDWVGSMVTTHFGLVSGLFWSPAPQGPQKGPFWMFFIIRSA